jgi:hypothetical protein
MPSASEFDQSGYCRAVLDPARKRGNVPPPDLLVRYAVSAEMEREAAAFQARVDEVVKYWRSVKQKKLYRKLAEALLAAHTELKAADKLSFAHFMQRRREERNEAQARLELTVKEIAANMPAVPRSTLIFLHDDCSGVLSEEAIQKEFAAHQVAIVDQEWVLPRRPPAQYSDLISHLGALGLRLAAEAVFGTEEVRKGFRLCHGFELASGHRLTKDLLDQKNKSLDQRPRDERNTALRSVLAVLQTAAARPGELDALLLWQFVDEVRPRLVAGLPIRSVTNFAAELGLDQAEAAELMLALTQHRSEATGSRVATLVREADEAVQANAIEEAAGLLTTALAMTSDGDEALRARLRSLPPPRPVRMLATPMDHRVRLEWVPGPARTAGIRYRVVRKIDGPAATSAAGLLLTETADHCATDSEPAFGERVYYTVFATRGADVWSEGTSADEVLLLPEVSECALESGEASVLGSWRVAPGTADVMVTRAEGSSELSASDMREIPASLAGFHDTKARPGIRYYYRIRAVYVSGAGHRRVTQGVGMWATPEEPLGVAPDFRAEVLPGPELDVLLSWDIVQTGTVRIYRSDRPPRWSRGTYISLEDLAGYGRPTSGQPVPGEPRESRLRVRPPNGRSYFCAVTVGASRAMIGPAVPVSVMRPVTDLRAERHGDRLRLDWQWAEDCYVCQIQWRPEEEQAGAAPPVECGLRRFHDDGGFEIGIGPQPGIVSVRSIHRDAESEIISAPADIPVPGRNVTVRYAFRRRTRWTPWRRSRLVLAADQAVRLPPLVVVHSAGRVMPLRAEQGTPVVRLSGADLPRAASWSVRIPAPPRRDPDWLACFFDGDPPAGIALVRAAHRS